MSTGDTRPIGATPPAEVPRYAGKATFARIADIHEVSDYEIAVLGVPFDGGTSYRPGARFGPMSVRQAARALRAGHHVELGVTPLDTVQIVDAGDAVRSRVADLPVYPKTTVAAGPDQHDGRKYLIVGRGYARARDGA